jgi:hypothetical protein
MAEKARKLAPTTLLMLLAVASFAAAAITITNITEWYVYAKTPPIVKVKGVDYGNYVNVSTSTVDSTNRTVISVLGFTGDPVKYDNVLYICNKDYQGYTYNVQLVYKGSLYGTNWNYVQYIKLYFGSGTLTIDSGTSSGAATASVSPGACEPVSVEVLVKPNAYTDGKADGSTRLIAIEVDVVATYTP